MMAMSRVLWLTIGYFLGFHTVGMSYWNSLSSVERFVVGFWMVGIVVALAVDRYIVPMYVDGGTT